VIHNGRAGEGHRKHDLTFAAPLWTTQYDRAVVASRHCGPQSPAMDAARGRADLEAEAAVAALQGVAAQNQRLEHTNNELKGELTSAGSGSPT